MASHRRIITAGPKLQTYLNRRGEWEVENELKINTGKTKTMSFTKARPKEGKRYYFGDQLIPAAIVWVFW
jgi:hypothetical protein